MRNGNIQRDLSLAALAAVCLLRPLPALADLPTAPPANNGVEGKFDDVTMRGMTFKQGREVTTLAFPGYVSVSVEIYGIAGAGSRPTQAHMKLEYRWVMLPNEGNMQLTESLTVNLTIEDKFIGKTTTERDDAYVVQTDWEKVGTTPYAMKRCNASSVWTHDGGINGSFTKVVPYSNQASADKTSWIKSQAVSATTTYQSMDPFQGPVSYSRNTAWNVSTGIVTSHTVSLNGANAPNPFGCMMMEAGFVGAGMDPQITDPSIPALSGVPMAWPAPPRLV